jgi:glycosyltransferase involved in cell wall biosynthesis
MAEPLSVVIIARDAAPSLPACLKSAGFADEILLVDSGSTDDTVAVAQGHGARVLHQDWLGFGPQKQFAVEQARHRWVLCLDADERVSEGLRAAIQDALATPAFRAYRMPRCNRFMGRWLRHGEGYPDLSLRLFDRENARWSDDPVHEKVVTDLPVGTLEGDLLHESQDSIAQYLEKQNRYTTLQAERLWEAGRQGSAGQMVLSPLLRFLKFYLLRRGFLDGLPGFVHIAIGCFNSFVKYAKLRELEGVARLLPQRRP